MGRSNIAPVQQLKRMVAMGAIGRMIADDFKVEGFQWFKSSVRECDEVHDFTRVHLRRGQKSRHAEHIASETGGTACRISDMPNLIAKTIGDVNNVAKLYATNQMINSLGPLERDQQSGTAAYRYCRSPTSAPAEFL